MSEHSNKKAGTFSQLFARHRERFVRFARGLVTRRDADNAEDCVQDASAEFVKQPREYGSESHFVRMFRRFVHNFSRSRRKRARAQKRGGAQEPARLPTDLDAGPAADQAGPRTAAMRSELHATLLEHLGRLKPDYQRVIELRLVGGLPWQDVATELDLPSEDAARKKYGLAIEQLRERAGHLGVPGSETEAD